MKNFLIRFIEDYDFQAKVMNYTLGTFLPLAVIIYAYGIYQLQVTP